MACRHRDMGLFIGNLNKAQGLLACLIWKWEELDWLLSRRGCCGKALAGHNRTSGVLLYAEEIEQRGDKWDRGLSLSIALRHRTIPHYLVTALLCSSSLLHYFYVLCYQCIKHQSGLHVGLSERGLVMQILHDSSLYAALKCIAPRLQTWIKLEVAVTPQLKHDILTWLVGGNNQQKGGFCVATLSRVNKQTMYKSVPFSHKSRENLDSHTGTYRNIHPI